LVVANDLVMKLENELIPTSTWVKCHLEIAKILYKNNRIEESIKALL
jgi:hypothetical protein